MKFLMILVAAATLVFSANVAHAGFQGVDNSGKSLGIFNTLKCADGAVCIREKGAFKVSGSGRAIHTTVSGATALTAAQCGQHFKNSATGVMTLPATTADMIGCQMTFIVANASNFDVNPNGTERIYVLTDTAGDAIRNSTLGASVTIELYAVGSWAVAAVSGTWNDVN